MSRSDPLWSRIALAGGWVAGHDLASHLELIGDFSATTLPQVVLSQDVRDCPKQIDFSESLDRAAQHWVQIVVDSIQQGLAIMKLLTSISVEQVSAFVELARAGSLKSASQALHLSEEGLRNRLIAIEGRLGVRLYEKERGRRGKVRITQDGRLFLSKANQFLEEAYRLTKVFEPADGSEDLLIAASQYVTYYVLIDAVREFRVANPGVKIRLFTRSEQEILAALGSECDIALGICAPPEFPPGVDCKLWFSLSWHVVVPRGHGLLHKSPIDLQDLRGEPLILFERGSTGREHVLEALCRHELTPHIVMETTSTQVIVRMVEAGLGIAIVPLLPSGAITRGFDVASIPLGRQVRPIDTYILSRPGAANTDAAHKFQAFLHSRAPGMLQRVSNNPDSRVRLLRAE
jgi:DNA-binding transcriptional LysR family regulator